MSDLLYENEGWTEDMMQRPSPPAPARVPTQPDIRLEPPTIPELKVHGPLCYFCGEQAHDDVNGIPQCPECQIRYRHK